MSRMNDLQQLAVKPCVDVYPSQDFPSDESTKYKALFDRAKEWGPGSEGNITITFGRYPCDACGTGVNWSYIGTDSTRIIPSMNLSTLDPPFDDFEWDGVVYPYELFKDAPRNGCPTGYPQQYCTSPYWAPGGTVLHEFGHAMAMKHEHQNYVVDNPLVFNDEVVYDDMAKPENGGWSREQTYENILKRYTCSANNKDDCPFFGSVFDTESVMIYYIPQYWLKEGTQQQSRFSYSKLDKEWLTATYPLNTDNKPKITVQFLDGEEWQKKWVEKLITENLAPLVGIDFTFDHNVPSLPPGVTYPPPIPGNVIDMTNEAIIGIVLGVFALLAFLMVIFG